jgi:hypothetical protein
MARNEIQPDVAYKAFNVAVTYDDTYTRVRIFTDEPFEGGVPVAEGKAKRRKGDARNMKLGLALATGRAFQDLADREARAADRMLEGQ